jgi:hypothetical protein
MPLLPLGDRFGNLRPENERESQAILGWPEL